LAGHSLGNAITAVLSSNVEVLPSSTKAMTIWESGMTGDHLENGDRDRDAPRCQTGRPET
jgi:hypothetical protein